MNETLKAWERLKKGIDTNVWECGYWDDIELIEKELKALEIIKKKQVQINRLNRSHSAKQYNLYLPKEMHLTQEEYDLLKEVLIDG